MQLVVNILFTVVYFYSKSVFVSIHFHIDAGSCEWVC